MRQAMTGIMAAVQDLQRRIPDSSSSSTTTHHREHFREGMTWQAGHSDDNTRWHHDGYHWHVLQGQLPGKGWSESPRWLSLACSSKMTCQKGDDWQACNGNGNLNLFWATSWKQAGKAARCWHALANGIFWLLCKAVYIGDIDYGVRARLAERPWPVQAHLLACEPPGGPRALRSEKTLLEGSVS